MQVDMDYGLPDKVHSMCGYRAVCLEQCCVALELHKGQFVPFLLQPVLH